MSVRSNHLAEDVGRTTAGASVGSRFVTRIISLLRDVLAVALAFHFLAGASHAQSRLLTAEPASSSQGVRTGAPATVVWKLNSLSSGILEGRFELTIFDEREIVGRVVTNEVVLGAGEQLQRIMLPALEVNNPSRSADVQLLFVDKHERTDLGVFSLRFSNTWERQFTICVCDPWNNKQSSARQSLINSLRFENYNPDPNDRSATTAVTQIHPEEMPQDGLGYCAYDLVVLMQEGFNELRERQLEALNAWIEAGGSALILPANARLKPSHVAFLNRLFKAPDDAPKFVADPAGRFVAADESVEANLHFVRRGLGRVVFVPGDPEALVQAGPLPYRRIQAFLWRLRHDQAAEFTAKAKWDSELFRREPDPNNPNMPDSVAMGRIRPTAAALAPVSLQSGDQMMQHLLPQDLRVLPLSLVGLLLFAYVLVIGPADYFILGALRQRKWTWVLFPAVTVGCTWLVVSLAHWYMAVRDDRHAVIFLDVGDGNRVVRRNRFEVLFSGTHRNAKTEVTQGIFTAMNHQQFGSSTWYAYQQAVNYGYNADDRFKLVGAPEIVGRFPSRYVVSQQLPQWTPQLNRQFSVTADSAVDEFDWNQFADSNVFHPRDFQTTDAPHRIESAVRAKFGPEARIFLLFGPTVWPLGGGSGTLFDAPAIELHQYPPRPVNVVNGRVITNNSGTPRSFLSDTCAFNDGGLFGVVSQIAPTGGRNFEDLSLLDPSDPDQWLLVVAVEREGDLLIYRKLYTGVR